MVSEKNKLRNLCIILLLLLCGLQLGLWFSSTGMRHLSSLNKASSEQLDENAIQKMQNEQLEAEVQNLRNGLEAVEERARSELGLIGEGEIFYQVIEAPIDDAEVNTETNKQHSDSNPDND